MAYRRAVPPAFRREVLVVHAPDKSHEQYTRSLQTALKAAGEAAALKIFAGWTLSTSLRGAQSMMPCERAGLCDLASVRSADFLRQGSKPTTSEDTCQTTGSKSSGSARAATTLTGLEINTLGGC
jgi:hypothetical protein